VGVDKAVGGERKVTINGCAGEDVGACLSRGGAREPGRSTRI